MEFQFRDGQSAEWLVARLADQRWWGEIVGPHGAGKSTLLATLAPRLATAGRQVHQFTLHDGERRLPCGCVRSALAAPRALLIVDGYEQLSRYARLKLRWQCRRAGAGLLVTSHAPTGLPPLVRLEADLESVHQLVDRLTRRVSSPINRADVVASHACHGSNVREVLFELYDRHELASRARRTGRLLPA